MMFWARLFLTGMLAAILTLLAGHVVWIGFAWGFPRD